MPVNATTQGERVLPPPPAPPSENRKINAIRKAWNNLTVLEQNAYLQTSKLIGWTNTNGEVSFNNGKMLVLRAMYLMNASRTMPLKLGE